MSSSGARREPPARRERPLRPAAERWEAMLPLALLAGLASGLAGVGLRRAVHALAALCAPVRAHELGALLLPAAGALAGALVVGRIFREPPGHGVPEVIRAVCREGGRMRARSMLSRWLGSLLHVGAGGSAGLEGPIVFSTAAIGSQIAGFFRLDERRRSVLLACGVAGGISGVFNAPMTAMIFATEVVLAEWTAFSIVPVVVASVAGTELARLLLGDATPFRHEPFAMGSFDLFACALLGALAGLCSVALARGIRLAHGLAQRVSARARLAVPLAAGLCVGAIGLSLPGAIGEGYDTAQSAIHGDLGGGLGLALALVCAKLVATSLSIGSGAPGGVFAPSLVLGALVGSAFWRALRLVLPAAPLGAQGSYALVGMSGLVAGVMQAPLTGMFLVLEVTRGYEVILPLMIVSVTALVVARRFEGFSLYTLELARGGELLRPGTDPRILADVALREALDEECVTVHPDMTLADFFRVASRTWRNHFPVLRTESGELVGMLDFGSVRELLADPELARLTLVGTVMRTDCETVPADASLADALDVFERSGAWVLPVVEGARFVGLLSKSTLFDRYRAELSVQTSA